MNTLEVLIPAAAGFAAGVVSYRCLLVRRIRRVAVLFTEAGVLRARAAAHLERCCKAGGAK